MIVAGALASTLALAGCTSPSGVVVSRAHHHAQRYSAAHYTLTVRSHGELHKVKVRKSRGRHCVVGAHYPECVK